MTDAEYTPDDLPDTYASICAGDCLAPTYKDGDCLVFSKTAEIKAGDFAGFWLRPGVAAEGENVRRVKRVVSLPPVSFPYEVRSGDEAVPLVIFEMFNPPRDFLVPAHRILAMHKVVGKAVENGDGTARVLSPEECAA